MEIFKILKKPIITEKSYKIMENNKYLFYVDIKASKLEIKKAFQTIFNVQVININTLKYKPKPKRVGRYLGKKPSYKKAIIQLKQGEKLQLLQDETTSPSPSATKKDFFTRFKEQFTNLQTSGKQTVIAKEKPSRPPEKEKRSTNKKGENN